VQLPESVCRLLWDYNLAAGSDGPAWERVVIERIMTRGRWSDMRWLLASFDRERLRRFLIDRGRRVLPPRELRFWGTVCGVAPAELDRWVGSARRREGAWRG
jgi:hypothetical protein